MNRQEKNRLLKVYRDCLKLKRKGKLTEYGEGQMDLCKMLLDKRGTIGGGGNEKATQVRE